jgi:competence protein ComEC
MLLIALCASALAGLALAQVHPLNAASIGSSAALATAAGILARHHHVARTAALVACAAAVGAARVTLVPPAPAVPIGRPPQEVLAPVRQAAQASIAGYLPEPQAGLASGVLLGTSPHLDPGLRLDLQRSGLAHLLAIDGFKQIVVAATVGAVFTRLWGPRLALLPTLATIAAYTLLTGAHPSAVRAALMVSLASVAAVIGRVADPLTSLSLAVLGMAMVEPRVLFDLGLQLSLSACLGIILLSPAVRRWLRLYRLPRAIAEPIGLTIAVTLGCLPLTLRVFQQVSLVSPLAHVLVVPLLPAVLVGSAGLAVAAALPAPLATAAAWLAWLPTSLLVAVVHACGSLPGAAVSTGRLPAAAAGGLAVILLGLGIWYLPELRQTRRRWWRWQFRQRFVFRPTCLVGACLASAALLHAVRPDGHLHVDRLAVGRGQALFVRGPTGRTALVALGGGSSTQLVGEVADHLMVWEHGLDQVVSFDSHASSALTATLARYPAGTVVHAQSAVRLDMGGGQSLEISSAAGQLVATTSGPTTSAARPA